MSMIVPMMRVRIMRMRMRQRFVPVRMIVRLLAVPGEVMCVLVMFVVHVCVRMEQRIMDVLVRMVFCEVQPDAEGHERAGDRQLQRQRFTHR